MKQHRELSAASQTIDDFIRKGQFCRAANRFPIDILRTDLKILFAFFYQTA